MKHSAVVLLAAYLTGCGSGSGGLFDPCRGPCYSPPPPQDCASLQTASWRVGPFPLLDEDGLPVTVGASRELWLDPFVEAHCAETIASVTWAPGDASVTSVTARTPGSRGAWVTGIGEGVSEIVARIAFLDGGVRFSAPRKVRVGPVVAPVGDLIAEGEVRLAAGGRVNVTFDMPRDAGRMDVMVDWGSVLNRAGMTVYRGTCEGAALCGGLQYVPFPDASRMKPVRGTALTLPAGGYTAVVHNSGPGEEIVRYEVRMTAR